MHSSSNSSGRRVRLWYWIFIPKANAFLAMLRPIPPMPRIPSVLPCGSRPMAGGGFPSHSPLRRDMMATLKFRRAPSMRKMAVSAVASSTAVGTLETLMPCFVQACTSIESYPAPWWQMNRTLGGREATSSSSNGPVISADSTVRKMTETWSRAPDLDSERKSGRLVAFGRRIWAIRPTSASASGALTWKSAAELKW